MEKNEYSTPDMLVIYLASEDIMTASGGSTDDPEEPDPWTRNY